MDGSWIVELSGVQLKGVEKGGLVSSAKLSAVEWSVLEVGGRNGEELRVHNVVSVLYWLILCYEESSGPASGRPATCRAATSLWPPAASHHPPAAGCPAAQPRTHPITQQRNALAAPARIRVALHVQQASTKLQKTKNEEVASKVS